MGLLARVGEELDGWQLFASMVLVLWMTILDLGYGKDVDDGSS